MIVIYDFRSSSPIPPSTCHSCWLRCAPRSYYRSTDMLSSYVYPRRFSTATSTARSYYLHPCRSLSDLIHDHAHYVLSTRTDASLSSVYTSRGSTFFVFLTSRSSVSCVHDPCYISFRVTVSKSICIYPGRCWPGIEAGDRACLIEGVSHYRPLVHFAAHGIVEVFCLRVEGFHAM